MDKIDELLKDAERSIRNEEDINVLRQTALSLLIVTRIQLDTQIQLRRLIDILEARREVI